MRDAVRLVYGLSRLCAWAAAAAFFVIGVIVAYEVAMRYLFAAPTRWVEECASVLQIYGVFLATASLVATRGHIRITVVSARLPARARLWAARAALVAVAATSALAAWYAGELIAFSVQTGQYTDSMLALPMWLLQAPVAAQEPGAGPVTVGDVFYGALPFVALILAAVAVTIAFPALALTIPFGL